MKIYLAGPIAGCTDQECNGWRTRAKMLAAKAGIECLDPMARDGRGVEMTPALAKSIVEGDKRDIMAADAVLVWYVKPTVGTSAEILYAWSQHIPVVIVDAQGSSLSPWLTYHSRFVSKSLEDAINTFVMWKVIGELAS